MHNPSAVLTHLLLSWDFTLILDQWPWDSASILSLECRLSRKKWGKRLRQNHLMWCANEQLVNGEKTPNTDIIDDVTVAASVHSTDDHKYWWRTIGDPWHASWIRSRTRERKNNQATNCVFFLLFAMVRWVAGSETSITPFHLLSLYPLTGSWAGGW